jgi:hypothetical protein
LRNTIFVSAEFSSCRFRNSNLARVDFEASSFTDCVFEGELRETLFAHESLLVNGLPPNEMRNVDFTRAKLLWVGFRGLNLDTVRFPEDAEHIILNDYPSQLDLLLRIFGNRIDTPSQALAAGLEVQRKWLGPKQRRGVLNTNDILEIGGQQLLDLVLDVLGRKGASTAERPN